MKKMLFLAALIFAATALSQQFPATMYVKVIYYDYHMDGSNPDFESSRFDYTAAGPIGNVVPGMVQSTLGPDRKPLLKANLVYNDQINNWWRPSDQGGATFSFNPATNVSFWSGLVPYNGTANEWVTPGHNATNTMANVVIYDSLPFQLTDQGTGTYQYNNQNFFPLDGKGFSDDGATVFPSAPGWTNPDHHNYAFSMELHQVFTYKKGLTFQFAGDDDVFAFINNTLVMDLGGIHSTAPGTVNLDNLGLTPGSTYNFDFFYCERNVTGSDIEITTNILSPGSVLKLYNNANAPSASNPPLGPSTSLQAGVQQTIYARVFDSTGVTEQPSAESSVQWTITDSTGAPIITIPNGPSATFTTPAYNGRVTVQATYTDQNGKAVTTTLTVNVVGGQTPGSGPSAGTVHLVSAITRDLNGNGYLDRIELHFDSLTSDNAVTAITIGSGLTFDSIFPQSGNAADSVFIVTLREPSSGALQTGLKPTITASGFPLVGPILNSPTSDGAGAVIDRAIFYPHAANGTGSFDTIMVTFSEPVNCATLTAASVMASFNYYDSTGALTQNAFSGATVDGCSGTMSSQVDILINYNDFTVHPGKDQLQLYANGLDAANNVPPPATIARKVVIQWGAGASFSMSTAPNPFTPGVSVIPGAVQNFYAPVITAAKQAGEMVPTATQRTSSGGTVSGPSGIIIAVASLQNLRLNNGHYGTAEIYDATGNKVVDNLPVDFAQNVKGTNNYGIYWNGQNQNGRVVGGGGYLMKIKVWQYNVISNGYALVTQRVKIGVKR